MHPRHRFGQNFMIDGNLVRLVAGAGNVGPGDWILEVGPGTGTLTDELLARGARVIAMEIDRDLAAILTRRYAGQTRIEIVEADALAGKHQLNPRLHEAIAEARAAGAACKLVANLPYNIASPLVIDLLIAGTDVLAFTVQKEVARRLVAPEDSDDYGPLSVMAQLLSRVEILRTLPPQAFWPAPKIDSALVRMTRADRTAGRAPALGKFVHAIFSSRRKTLRNALKNAGFDPDAALAAASLDGTARPESLSPEKWLELFQVAAGMKCMSTGEDRLRPMA